MTRYDETRRGNPRLVSSRFVSVAANAATYSKQERERTCAHEVPGMSRTMAGPTKCHARSHEATKAQGCPCSARTPLRLLLTTMRDNPVQAEGGARGRWRAHSNQEGCGSLRSPALPHKRQAPSANSKVGGNDIARQTRTGLRNRNADLRRLWWIWVRATARKTAQVWILDITTFRLSSRTRSARRGAGAKAPQPNQPIP